MTWLDQCKSVRFYGMRALALVTATLLIACEGESRPFEEAVLVQSLRLTDIQITRPFIEQTERFSATDDVIADEDFIISKGRILQLGLNGINTSQGNVPLDTADLSWRSTNSSVVSVTDDGVITGGIDGEADILVTIGGLESAAFPVRVSDAALDVISAIHRVPDDSALAADALERCLPGEFFAVGTFSDGSLRPVHSDDVDYTVSEEAGVFTDVTNRQTVTVYATMSGEAILSAAADDIAAASRPLNVLNTLVSIAISPNPAGLDEDSLLNFTAIGTYSNEETAANGQLVNEQQPMIGRTVNITTNVQWEIIAGTEFASVSNDSGNEGQVTGLSDGIASLQASCGNLLSEAVPVNVNEADASDSDELSFQLALGNGSLVLIPNDGTLSLEPFEEAQIEVTRGSEFDRDEPIISSSELDYDIDNLGATDITLSTTGLITAGSILGSATITVTLDDNDDVSGTLTVTVINP